MSHNHHCPLEAKDDRRRMVYAQSCDRDRRFGYDLIVPCSDLHSQYSEFRQTSIAHVVPHTLPATRDITKRLPDWLLFEFWLVVW